MLLNSEQDWYSFIQHVLPPNLSDAPGRWNRAVGLLVGLLAAIEGSFGILYTSNCDPVGSTLCCGGNQNKANWKLIMLYVE